MINEKKNKVYDDYCGCRLSLIVSRIVTRGSLTSIIKPNLDGAYKNSVLHNSTSHTHIHMKNNQQCDEAQKKPHSIAFFKSLLTRPRRTWLTTEFQQIGDHYQNFRYLKRDSVLVYTHCSTVSENAISFQPQMIV